MLQASKKHQTALRMSQDMESVSDYFRGNDPVAKEHQKNPLEGENRVGKLHCLQRTNQP